MTREEMIKILKDHCNSTPFFGCPSCPIRKTVITDGGCVKFEDRTDEELVKCIEKITPVKQVAPEMVSLDGTVYTQDTDGKGWTGHPKPERDPVNHPQHYELPGGLECFDVLLATQGVGPVQEFCLCNAMKYLFRHRRKNGFEDVKKAHWYLTKYIEMETKEREKDHDR